MVPTVWPTPLLERQQPVAQPRRRRRAIGLLIGGAIGLVVDLFGRPYFGPGRVLVWMLAFVAALFVGLLFHELGHLAAGKLAGFEFHQIVAGPWIVSKDSRGNKLRFFPRGILMFAGHTVMIPRNTEKLRRGFALFAAGGPVVTALLFLPLILLPWSLATSSALVANLLLAVFSWIPMTIGGSRTDGKILRTLAGAGASADRFAAILYLVAIDNQGVEPRRWPHKIMEKLAADAPGWDLHGEAAVLLHIYTFDCGETEATAAALEQVLAKAERLRPELRRHYFAEAAFFQGVYRKNGPLARAWLEDARRVKAIPALKDWDAPALAAIAGAEGNVDEARAQIGRAIAYLDRQPGERGSILAARRRLAVLTDSHPALFRTGSPMGAPEPSM